MSNGGGHGAVGRYPDNWDKQSRTIVVEQDPEPSSVSESVDPINDDPGGDDPDRSDLSFDDGPDDARNYECECGEELEYHADECPDCGEPKQWRDVQ